MIFSPKFVLIDTFAINEFARSPYSELSSELKQVVSEGFVVPFVTEHQMEEIAQHENDEVFYSRIRYLGGLSHIAFCGDSVYGSGLGSVLDLREHEMRYLLEHPEASYNEVISAIRPTILDGYCSGPQFVSRTKEGLHVYRKGLHRFAVSQSAEIASMDHFPLVDNDTPFSLDPEDGAPDTAENLARWLKGKKEELVTQIKQFGDDRVSDPEAMVEREFSDYIETVEGFRNDSRGFLQALCDHYQIQLNRLPEKATIEDAGSEAIFVANLRLHGERMGIDPETLLLKIRKEQLPSWVVWDGLLRKMRTADKTRGSNGNDRFLACFGPYVDILQVDKRTKDHLRQLATGSKSSNSRELFQQTYRKVPQKNGVSGLLREIRRLSSAI